MTPKLLEIRDRATAFPVLAIDISGADGFLAQRAGFESRMIYFVWLNRQEAKYDPWNWSSGARTVKEAHRWISEHWDEIENEDVIDVEFILGETTEKKVSERFHVRER